MALSEIFFEELEIPQPAYNLGVGSGSHAKQTADIMVAFEPIPSEEKPDAIVVVGDVNSTIACALVALKLGIEVVHVEVGLRSFDRRMPEEVNRVLTDAISDHLFVSEPAGVENLLNEGIGREKIHLVGNVMIDTLIRFQEKANSSKVHTNLGLRPGEYGVVTLHRPSNVDDAETFKRVLRALGVIAR